MRRFTDRFFDFWDDLGIWSQYGLAVVGAVGLLALAAVLISQRTVGF